MQMYLLNFVLELLVNRHAHEKGGLFHKDEVQGDHCKEFDRIGHAVFV
jgi:hypothetical protein